MTDKKPKKKLTRGKARQDYRRLKGDLTKARKEIDRLKDLIREDATEIRYLLNHIDLIEGSGD